MFGQKITLNYLLLRFYLSKFYVAIPPQSSYLKAVTYALAKPLAKQKP